MASKRPPNSHDRPELQRGEIVFAHDPFGRGEVQGKSVPAWIMSLLLHVGVVLVLALVLRQAPRGIATEPERTTGIALVSSDSIERQYTLELEDANEIEETSTANSTSPNSENADALSEVLPSKAELNVDLSGILPSAPDGADEIETDGMTDIGDAIKSGERTSSPSGDITTSVFGIEGTGTRFVYVFDRSGSMDGFGGAPLRAAKAELLASLNDLQRGHQFQIIFYNEQPRVFNPTGGEPSLVWGDEAGKQLAKRFVTGIAATGGTRHMQAMRLALGMRPDVVFFLTDADEPQMTEGELSRVRRLNYGAAIHAIEFGYGPKRSGLNFLKRLAEQNRGRHIYVDLAKLRKGQR